MMKIFLVRHGVTEFNQKRRIQGQKDIPLAPEGRIQARETGSYLQSLGLKKIYSSDLSRARETAQIIAEPIGFTPVEVLGLREINMGRWEGLSWEEVGEKFPEEQKAWVENPLDNGPSGGENIKQAADRFEKTIFSITEPGKNGSPILIVSHGLVIATLVASMRGKSPAFWRDFSPDNASITELRRENNTLELISFNKPV